MTLAGHMAQYATPMTPMAQPLCFTLESTTFKETISLNKNGSPDPISLEYSTDGNTWSDYTWDGTTGLGISLNNNGDKVYFRAKNENSTINSNSMNYYLFGATGWSGTIRVSGNIQTLLKADGSRTDAPAYCYYSLLSRRPDWKSAPELPATTLASHCYDSMFTSASGLTSAPALPATTLAEGCYNQMFSGCTSLTTTPELPATTIATICYQSMFRNCTSLTSAPTLPATTISNGCYKYMFQGCSSLSSITVGFTQWNDFNPTENWLYQASSTGTFTCPEELPDIRDASHIPVGWTVAHPAVAALRFDILADDTSIDIINDSGTLEPPDLEYSVDDGETWTQWVPGSDFPHEMAGAVVYVRAGATGNIGFTDPNTPSAYWHFTSDDLFSASGNIMYLLSRDGSTGLSDYCFYRLFDGCTMLVDASDLELPATTLADSCYEGMFRGCTSLTSAPELPATSLAFGCYKGMLSACTSLTAAPELPATTLADHCYHYMFRGCTALVATPELPATSLADSCYQSMFSGCSSLSSVEVAFTAWNPQSATNNWLRNVAASGTFTCPAALPDIRGDSNIPEGWTKVDAA